MRKSKLILNTIVSCLLVVSMISSSVFAANEPSQNLLSPQSFIGPGSDVMARQNSISAYLEYSITALIAKGKDFGSISADDFQTIQAHDRRISVISVNYNSADSAIIICRTGNTLYEADVKFSGLIPDVSGVREAGNIPARFFPALPSLAIESSVRSKAQDIIGNIRYSRGVHNKNDTETLYSGLFNLLKAALVDHNMFSDIGGSAAFFMDNDTYPVDINKIINNNVNAGILEKLVREVSTGVSPAAKADIAAVCDAIGKALYLQRRAGYEGAVIFYGLAHELEPGDPYYHKDFARSLYHVRRIPEARREQQDIISKNPHMKSVFVDMFDDDRFIAENNIKELISGRFSLMSIREKASQVRVLMAGWKCLEEKDYSKYPRARSAAGQSHNMLARVSTIVSKNAGSRPERAALLADAMREIAKSSAYLKLGYEEALPIGIKGQIDHASSMRKDIMRDNMKIVKDIAGAFAGEGYRIPGRIELLQASVRDISESLHGLDIGFATDFEVVLRWLLNYCEAQKRAEKVFREAILKCSESDVNNPGAFLVRCASTSVDSIFAVNGHAGVSPQLTIKAAGNMTKDIAGYYRRVRSIDDTAIAAIFVRLNMLGGKDPTHENILKVLTECKRTFSEFSDIALPESEKDWDMLVKKLNPDFNLGLVIKPDAGKKEDYKPASAARKPLANMLDRAHLKKSISPSEEKSVVSRLAHLEGLIKKVDIWGSISWSLQTYFSTSINKGLAREAEEVKAYTKGVAEYLEREGQKGIGKEERDALRVKGSGFTVTLDRLEAALKDREDLVKHRVARIKSDIVFQTIVGIKSRLQNFGIKYAGLGSEYVDSQMELLAGYVEDVSSVQDENSGDYLSYDAFISMVDRIEMVIAELKDFADKLDTFRPYISAIDSAVNEARLQASFFGPSEVIDEYAERLTEAKDSILEYVRSGKTIDDMEEDERNFYSNIKNRTELFFSIRKVSSESLYKHISQLKTAANSAEAEKRDAMRREILSLLAANLYQKTDPNPDISRLCDLLAPIPLDDEIGILTDRIEKFITILTDTGDVVNPIYWEVTENNFRAIARLLPGSVTREQMDSIAKYRAIIEDVRKEVKKLRISDPEFISKLRALNKQVFGEIDYIHAHIVDIYQKWNRALGKQLAELRDLTAAYLEGWNLKKSESFENAHILAGFTSMVETLSGDFNEKWVLPDISGKLNKAKSATITLAKANLLDRAFLRELSDLKTGMLLSEFSRIFSLENETQAAQIFDNTQMLYTVERDASGKVEHVRMLLLLLLSTKGRDTRYGEMSFPGAQFKGAAEVGDFDITGNTIADKMNASEISTDPRFEGIRLSPYQFLFFINAAAGFYDKCKLKSSKLGGSQLPEIKTIELAAAMSGQILEDERFIVSSIFESVREDDPTVLAILGKERALREAIDALGPDAAAAEKGLLDKIAYYKDGMADMFSYGFYYRQRVAAFLKNTTLLLNKVTGKNYSLPEAEDAKFWADPPRLFLTLPDGGMHNISSVYPAVKEYAGVYLDASKAVFKIRKGYETAMSTALCASLNNALGAYLGAVAGDKDESFEVSPRYEWQRIVSSALSGIKRYSEMEVVVSKDVPTRNSMSIEGTLIFDKDFIDHVTKPGEDRAAAEIILGERIFHELGMAAEDEGAGIGNIKGVIQKGEEEQLYRDVVLYARIFSEKPELKPVMESYTDTLLTDSFTGRKAKFSKVFATKDLYRNIQKWAGEIDISPDKVKGRIKIFVGDFLDNVNITSKFVRFFPAKPAQAGRSSKEYSAGMVLATHMAMGLKEDESRILDNLTLKDAGFFAKTRRIVISSALIPECQKGLIPEINKRSAEAFASGFTKDIVEIKSLDYIQSIKSGDDAEAVVLLEKSEAPLYTGDESRLVFETDKVDPILLNGLVAAGRAVVYGEMEALRRILLKLGRLPDGALPSVSELERMLKSDNLRRLPVIFLPPVKILTSEIGELNRAILKLMQYA